MSLISTMSTKLSRLWICLDFVMVFFVWNCLDFGYLPLKKKSCSFQFFQIEYSLNNSGKYCRFLTFTISSLHLVSVYYIYHNLYSCFTKSSKFDLYFEKKSCNFKSWKSKNKSVRFSPLVFFTSFILALIVIFSHIYCSGSVLGYSGAF